MAVVELDSFYSLLVFSFFLSSLYSTLFYFSLFHFYLPRYHSVMRPSRVLFSFLVDMGRHSFDSLRQAFLLLSSRGC